MSQLRCVSLLLIFFLFMNIIIIILFFSSTSICLNSGVYLYSSFSSFFLWILSSLFYSFHPPLYVSNSGVYLYSSFSFFYEYYHHYFILFIHLCTSQLRCVSLLLILFFFSCYYFIILSIMFLCIHLCTSQLWCVPLYVSTLVCASVRLNSGVCLDSSFCQYP